MKQDLIIYHGSQQIVETPKFGIGKTYNDYGKDFTARRALSWQKNGLALLKMMAIPTSTSCTLMG